MNLFEKALRAYYGAPDDQPSLAMLESMTEKYAMGGGMQPAIDVVVADTRKRIAYLIRAELPAVKKEDVKVTVDQGMITIEGERTF